jgi:hypothetical protein
MGYLDLAKKAIKTNSQWMTKTKDPQAEIDKGPFIEDCSNDGNEINEKDEICPGGETTAVFLKDYPVLFEKAVSEMAAMDPEGEGIRFIREDYPNLWAKIYEAQERVNDLWLKARSGQKVMHEYQKAVLEWQKLIRSGLKLFRTLFGD